VGLDINLDIQYNKMIYYCVLEVKFTPASVSYFFHSDRGIYLKRFNRIRVFLIT